MTCDPCGACRSRPLCEHGYCVVHCVRCGDAWFEAERARIDRLAEERRAYIGSRHGLRAMELEDIRRRRDERMRLVG